MCARGTVDPDRQEITIGFRYGGRAYSHNKKVGYIGKGSVAFRASEVVPEIPKAVAARIQGATGPCRPKVLQRGKSTFEIKIDLAVEPELGNDVIRILGPGSNYASFLVPVEVMEDGLKIKTAFLRGFAQVCGLASSGTNLYGGLEQIWLRPDTENKPLFYQLMALLEHMGLTVYWNDRDERDIALKVNCEAWQRIGFGIAWLDKIVAEGARLNESVGGRSR